MTILAEFQTRVIPAGHKTRQQIEDIIPFGLSERLESILSQRKGEALAIKMIPLLGLLKTTGFPTDSRSVRSAIRELRRLGLLICSGASGYHLAGNLLEAIDFIEREIDARAHDLLETGRKMRESAKREFGEGVQRSLF